MKTIENNILIAEFLGYSLDDKQLKTYRLFENGKFKYINLNNDVFSDWNWLMEVVKNIESLSVDDNYYSFYVGISTVGSLIQPKTKSGFPTLNCNINTQHREGSKLENTYNACVEFIKWYNQQKN